MHLASLILMLLAALPALPDKSKAAPVCTAAGCPGTDKPVLKADPPPAPAPAPVDPLVAALQAARTADNILAVKQGESDTAAAAAAAAKDADDQAWVAFYSQLSQAGRAAPPNKPAAAKKELPPPPPIKPLAEKPAPPSALPTPKITLIEVSASSGCARCEQMKPVFDQIKADGFDVQRVDAGPLASLDQGVLVKWGVKMFPTWILLKDGKEVTRSTDWFTVEEIESALKAQ